MEKIDIHKVGASVQKLKAEIKNDDLIAFLRDKKIGKFGKKIKQHQEKKYIRYLSYIRKWMGKPLSEITENDATEFYEKLSEDGIVRENGKPYTNESKSSFINVFKTYIRYLCEIRYPDNKDLDYLKIGRWMKGFEEGVKITALSKSEVVQLASVNNLKNNALILTMFDSGARVQEFLNIRISDVKKIKDNGDFYFKITLRKEFSKTEGRVVSCRICKDVLKPYYNKRKAEVEDEEEQLFNVGYGTIRKLLQRSKQKTGLKKRVSPHVIRHSSATYFANVLKNPFQLEYRYGWNIGESHMVNRYIDPKGMLEEESSKEIKKFSMADLKEENDQMKIQMLEMQRQMKIFMAQKQDERKGAKV